MLTVENYIPLFFHNDHNLKSSIFKLGQKVSFEVMIKKIFPVRTNLDSINIKMK